MAESTAVDVAVVGGGPAGRAIASACVDTGLRVVLIDPAPRRVWPYTYAAWQHELPAGVAHSASAMVLNPMRAVGTTAHEWPDSYTVLDNTALWKYLWRAEVVEVSSKAISAEHGPNGSTVLLKDGRRISAAAVVDASGRTRALCGGRPARTPARQSAVGVVLATTEVEELCPAGTGLFMDWRPVSDAYGDWPTFLYAIEVRPGRTLVEETCLARRPALPLASLRRRLRSRLAAYGITVPDKAQEERVRFPVDDPLPRPGRVIPFGAAAALVHPTTGFSVAASLRLAPWVAAALAAGLSTSPTAAAKSAWSILWSPKAVATHRLRHRALNALLSMPPHRVPEFFDVFFALESRHRAAFQHPDPDPITTVAAMAALFRSAPWTIRRHMIAGGVRPSE